MQAATNLPTRRRRSHELLVDELARLLAPLQEAGFHGSLPVDIVLRNGVVELLRVKGAEQTIKIQAPGPE